MIMTTARWRIGALAASALLVLGATAACGGDDGASTPTAPVRTGGTAAPATGGKVEVPAGAPEIDQDNLAFKPDKLTVKSGEKVYFKNSETALHTVTINGKNESGNMKKGDVFVWTPAEAKTYKITCDYHPQMNATITAQ